MSGKFWPGSKEKGAKAHATWTGSGRRKLKIKDPQRYSWQPREVLAQIAAIYINLSRADVNGVFAREIVNDERSYSASMFAEAAQARVLPSLCCHVSGHTC